MIVNVEREPELSLYYLGSVLLKILKSKKLYLSMCYFKKFRIN